MCNKLTTRTFKTKKFSKQCYGIGITDDELCKCIVEVMQGKTDDLGGGVFKKKLNKNMHRSIVLQRVEAFGSMNSSLQKAIEQTSHLVS